jgi:hypothetical protein
VRSDFSVYHRIDDIEAMPAPRFVAYMLRLPIYGGATAYLAQKDAQDPQEPAAPLSQAESAQWQDIADALKTDPLFIGQGTYVQVPAE